MNGKGSTPRPRQVGAAEWSARWEAAFGAKEKKILFKFPTRGRPAKFLGVLSRYYAFIRGARFEFLVSCDVDDETMNNPAMKERLSAFPNLRVSFSANKNKVEAINADMEGAEFDILVLLSDDMIPMVPGFDQTIRQGFEANFPDGDGVLWFFDGVRHHLNTLCILGKKYYRRFGYIYFPGYQTWYCDDEFTAVATALGRQKRFGEVIVAHQHPGQPAEGTEPEVSERWDETFWRNNTAKEKDADRALFSARKEEGFGVP